MAVKKKSNKKKTVKAVKKKARVKKVDEPGMMQTLFQSYFYCTGFHG